MVSRSTLLASIVGATVMAAPVLALAAKPMSAPMPGHLIGSVPEPATWAMMLVGFGLMGALLRVARRRRIATA